jgi:hypothetical protein
MPRVTIYKQGEDPIEITVSTDEIANEYGNLVFSDAPGIDAVTVSPAHPHQ